MHRDSTRLSRLRRSNASVPIPIQPATHRATTESLELRILLTGLTYYVDVSTGNDANVGTAESLPLKTIQQAVSLAGSDNAISQSDTIVIHAGVYREMPFVRLNDSGASATDRTVITAAPLPGGGYEPVYINAADPITGTWIQDGNSNRWYLNNFVTPTAGVWVDWSPGNDGAPLAQIGAYTGDDNRDVVGNGPADMTPGTFFGDQADGRLYVWLADGGDPNLHPLEYANRGREIYQPGTLVGGHYVYPRFLDYRGLNLRHDNPYDIIGQDIGCAMYTTNDERLIDMDVQWNGETGVILRDTSQMINCNCSNNGGTGVNGQSTGGRITGGTYDSNWWRNYTTGGGAGIKFISNVPTVYGNVIGVEASFNNGYGIWYDTCFENTALQVISNNYLHDNAHAGIDLEASRNFLVVNNVIVANAEGGISCNAVENAKIYNNTFVGNGGRATIELNDGTRDQGSVYPGTTGMIDISIRNNIVADNYSVYDLDVPTDFTGAEVHDNTSDYNLFYRRGETLHFTTGGDYAAWGRTPSTLSDWQTASGQDLHSVVADPLFLAGGTATGAFVPGADSSALGAGLNLFKDVTNDYAGAARPPLSAFDVGAYQYTGGGVGTPGPVVVNTDPAVWWDDQLPINAAMTQPDSTGNSGPDKFWSWETNHVLSGALALDSGTFPGAHDQYFTGAAPRTIGTNDALFAFVYLDPAHPPAEIQLQWQDASGSWDHRAYWGPDLLHSGVDGTDSQRHIGDLPAVGTWAQLLVPAADVGLSGVTITGFSFDLFNGHAELDKAGNATQKPAWLDPSIQAVWNPADHVLSVTGSARIIADPGADEPMIHAVGPASRVAFESEIDRQFQVGGLNLTGGASAVVARSGVAGDPFVLIVNSQNAPLTIDGSLDLNDNDLVVRGGDLSAITGWVAEGFDAKNGGDWDGPGIRSSAAAADTATTLGAVQPSTTQTIDGQLIGPGDVIVKYTYWGDANLDGQVDGSDYTQIDYAFGGNLTGWANGDFNDDGIVDGSDYTLIDNSFNTQGVRLAPAISLVPAKQSISTSDIKPSRQWWTSKTDPDQILAMAAAPPV